MIANIEALKSAIADLSMAAKAVLDKPPIASDICTAVANVIASAKYGSGSQRELMDAASEVGFTPEYYANSIRVGWARPEPTQEQIAAMLRKHY